MLTISVQTRVIIGVIITTAIGVSTGAVQLTHAIPSSAIPAVVAWCGIFAFVGSALQTALQAAGLTDANKTAAAESLPDAAKVHLASSLPADQKVALAASAPEVSQIVTTRAIAQAAGPDGDGAKVVSRIAA